MLFDLTSCSDLICCRLHLPSNLAALTSNPAVGTCFATAEGYTLNALLSAVIFQPLVSSGRIDSSGLAITLLDFLKAFVLTGLSYAATHLFFDHVDAAVCRVDDFGAFLQVRRQ